MTVVEVSAVVTAAATVVFAVGTFLFWKLSRDTTLLLHQELQNQNAARQSISHHSVLDAHRSLILELLRDEKLLRAFSGELGLTPEDARTKFLATLLINHARRIFIDHHHRLAGDGMDSFSEDARELFTLPFIQSRWAEVKEFHPPEFKRFVETRLLVK
jgi:hypothetical protein